MNILTQVATLLRIRFISPCQAFERGSKLVPGSPVKAILICFRGQIRFPPHSR